MNCITIAIIFFLYWLCGIVTLCFFVDHKDRVMSSDKIILILIAWPWILWRWGK